jgi:3-oxoacyl-[acyl-carrier-protein] synthase II
VAAILAIIHHELPPNLGMNEQDPEIPLEHIVTDSTPWEPGAVASNSFGFGGHNTVLVLTPPT